MITPTEERAVLERAAKVCETLYSMKKLRLAHWNQLAAYIKQANEDGWYYGNREQFDKRHKELYDWVWEQADKANKKEFPK